MSGMLDRLIKERDTLKQDNEKLLSTIVGQSNIIDNLVLEQHKLIRLANCKTTDSFLQCDEATKRAYFAMMVHESARNKVLEAKLKADTGCTNSGDAATATLARRVSQLECAIDDEMVSCYIGTFGEDDEPKDAINKLMCYWQGVGSYFGRADVIVALKDMIKEYQGLDLPYGSVAYANAVEICRDTDSEGEAVHKQLLAIRSSLELHNKALRHMCNTTTATPAYNGGIVQEALDSMPKEMPKILLQSTEGESN